jgi:hypothetical protein
MPDELPQLIDPDRVRVHYIKLGRRGSLEQMCVTRGLSCIGFGAQHPDRFGLCESRRWDELRTSFVEEGKSDGTATSYTNQVRAFFEDEGDRSVLWITFVGERLYWGFAEHGRPELDSVPDWVCRRGRWSSDDRNGGTLSRAGQLVDW